MSLPSIFLSDDDMDSSYSTSSSNSSSFLISSFSFSISASAGSKILLAAGSGVLLGVSNDVPCVLLESLKLDMKLISGVKLRLDTPNLLVLLRLCLFLLLADSCL